jgi:ribokinase
MGKIIVIGSSNTDMVVKTGRLPAPGETVIGGEFLMNPGGKGANQAVAAARLGGDVRFVAKVGNDLFGKQAVQGFRRDGIDTSPIFTDPQAASGVALISVDEKGENCIVVAPGANARLTAEEVSQALENAGAGDTVLIQLEIPLGTVEAAVRLCAAKGVGVILNPAPAQPLPDDLFPRLAILVPNETEAGLLTGIPVTDAATAEAAARQLAAKGVGHVVITLGAKGAYSFDGQQGQLIEAPHVHAVDTTAAGDCFSGALAVAVSEGQDLPAAIDFACRAAALSVTRMGAQASLPYRKEL